MSNPNIPWKCNGCGAPLLLENLFADDGCPCNTPRGVNFAPQPCALCRIDCVKPGHHIEELFGCNCLRAEAQAKAQRSRSRALIAAYVLIGLLLGAIAACGTLFLAALL